MLRGGPNRLCFSGNHMVFPFFDKEDFLYRKVDTDLVNANTISIHLHLVYKNSLKAKHMMSLFLVSILLYLLICIHHICIEEITFLTLLCLANWN